MHHSLNYENKYEESIIYNTIFYMHDKWHEFLQMILLNWQTHQKNKLYKKVDCPSEGKLHLIKKHWSN